MKKAGTIKNGLSSSKPAISILYCFIFGSLIEHCRNSSDIDSIFDNRFSSVISDFSIYIKYKSCSLLSRKK